MYAWFGVKISKKLNKMRGLIGNILALPIGNANCEHGFSIQNHINFRRGSRLTSIYIVYQNKWTQIDMHHSEDADYI